MNWWWLLFMLVGCLWLLPLLAMHMAASPKVLYIAVATLWLCLFLFIRPLYDWGTDLLRKFGLDRMADFRERLKRKILSPVRAALLIMALLSIVFVFLQRPS